MKASIAEVSNLPVQIFLMTAMSNHSTETIMCSTCKYRVEGQYCQALSTQGLCWWLHLRWNVPSGGRLCFTFLSQHGPVEERARRRNVMHKEHNMYVCTLGRSNLVHCLSQGTSHTGGNKSSSLLERSSTCE